MDKIFIHKGIVKQFVLFFHLITLSCCADSSNFPNPKNGNTHVIAHRGAHKDIPENTLSAYQKAIDLGCDFVEIDIRKTKDGKFVSVHNSTIDNYVDGISGRVSDFSLAELKEMNIGKRYGPGWENERIPTLAEILELCKGKIGIYLDLKEPYVEEILDIIRKYEMEKNIIWYIPMSQIEAIKELQTLCEKCIPMPDPGPMENIEYLESQIQPLIIASDMNELSAEFVEISHANNIKVFVDEKEGNKKEWRKMLEWEVDGIQTDSPKQLIKFLKSN